MTLRKTSLVNNSLLLAGLALLVAAALWGLLRQRGHVRTLLDECSAVRLVESAEARVLSAKSKLRGGPAGGAARADLRAALGDLKQYRAVLSQYNSILGDEISPAEQADVKAKTKAALADLAALVALAEGPAPSARAPAPPFVPDAALVSARADDVAEELALLLRTCNGIVNQTGLASERDLHRAIALVASLAGAILASAAALSLWHYRRIMLPLERLRLWSRRVASGDFSARCRAGGGEEFGQLSRELNQMGDELNAFYRELEAKVAAKSKELVRSERLASVGYLAAGVAHEINNPLNIMSGYAELSLRRLARAADEERLRLAAGHGPASPGAATGIAPEIAPRPAPVLMQQVADALQIIREEAFRCKEITGRLLSLARKGGDAHENLSLTQIAVDVATMVRGLKNFRSRRLVLNLDRSEPLEVRGNVNELKQVLLNLTVNALEAVAPDQGEVWIEGRADAGWAELHVRDNGRGMTPETLERVFEPFYTDKRGAGEPGTGLGLSITHAIVTDHGGEIRAQSPGPGHGSRFTVRLPRQAGERRGTAQARA